VRLATKVLLKRLIIAHGGFHRLSSADFEAALRGLLDGSGRHRSLVACGGGRRMFPRSNPVLRRNDAILRALAPADDGLRTHADAVRYWTLPPDHAHLNDAGHGRIAGSSRPRRGPGDAARGPGGRRARTRGTPVLSLRGGGPRADSVRGAVAFAAVAYWSTCATPSTSTSTR